MFKKSSKEDAAMRLLTNIILYLAIALVLTPSLEGNSEVVETEIEAEAVVAHVCMVKTRVSMPKLKPTRSVGIRRCHSTTIVKSPKILLTHLDRGVRHCIFRE